MRLKATSDRPGREPPELARSDELERQLPLVDAELGIRERTSDERQRIERTEQPDVAVLAGEEQLRPGRPPLLVVRPLDLVQDEHLAGAGGHLDGAAENRRLLVDPLLAGDQADPLLPEPRAEAAVRLLREHAERPGVDPSPPVGEELERVVGLARVRRPEMRDDRLRRRTTLGQPDRDPVLGTPDRSALVRAGRAGVAGGPAWACAAGAGGVEGNSASFGP